MRFEAEIKNIKNEAKNVKTFIFDKPDEFSFIPGQYCWLSLPNFDPAPMAIASGKSDQNLEFSIRQWGELTEALFQKNSGDKVIIDGPYGSAFPIDNVTNGNELYLIGGGTGITPIRSVVRSLPNTSKTVYYGAKHPSELLYQYEFNTWPAKINLTVDEKNDSWSGNVGLVTDLLNINNMRQNGLYFVCGPESMEKAVVDYLNDKDIDDSQIYVSLEKFDEEGNVIGPVLPVSDKKVPF